jgi:predicted nucleic acid-binding protein
MTAYADTSFLVALYHPAATHHPAAARVADAWTAPPRLPLTPFGAAEFQNALLRLAHAGVLRAAEVRAATREMEEDTARGYFERLPLHAYQWIQEAGQIMRLVTPQTGARTLDGLHLALARIHGTRVLLSFDGNQRRAALAAGMKVAPA